MAPAAINLAIFLIALLANHYAQSASAPSLQCWFLTSVIAIAFRSGHISVLIVAVSGPLV